MNKYILKTVKIIFVSTFATSLYANTANTANTGSLPSTSDSSYDSTTSTTTTTTSSNVDKVSTGQASTLTSNCISVSKLGKICDKKADTWCSGHVGAKECKNFQYFDSSVNSPDNSD